MSFFSINNLVDVIRFVAVLSILVIVHELGHFFAAIKSGIWVEEFGIGFPPRIWGKKIKNTIYSVNLLPLGGFVRLHGEQTEDGVTKPKEAFINKSKMTRFFVLAAGVFMNFVLGVICFAIYYSFSGVPRTTDKVIISDVVINSPAAAAGIEPSDVVLSVDGIKIKSLDDFSKLIAERKGEQTNLSVLKKSGETKNLSIIPRTEVPENEGPLGVLITQTEIYFPPIWQRPFIGVAQGFKDAFYWGKQILSGLYLMVSYIVRGQVPKDVAGPIGMFALTSEVAKLGILELINFMGIISVNLAIVNFLPIPALDGGRFLFIVVEKIMGRKVVPKVEAAIHGAGMAILLLLMLIITLSEVKRLIVAGSLQGFLESTLK